MSADAAARPSSPKRQRTAAGTPAAAASADATMASDESKSDASSWVAYSADCEFPVQNIPFGIFRPTADAAARIGTAIGDQVRRCAALCRCRCCRCCCRCCLVVW